MNWTIRILLGTLIISVMAEQWGILDFSETPIMTPTGLMTALLMIFLLLDFISPVDITPDNRENKEEIIELG